MKKGPHLRRCGPKFSSGGRDQNFLAFTLRAFAEDGVGFVVEAFDGLANLCLADAFLLDGRLFLGLNGGGFAGRGRC